MSSRKPAGTGHSRRPSEAEIQADIRVILGRRPELRIFRNTVGEGWMGDVLEKRGTTMLLQNARPVTFGLMPGSADLIGWRTRIVTPDMVGQAIAIFTSIEVKRPGGRASTSQIDWMCNVVAAGGIAAIVNSPETALAALGIEA